MDGRAGYPKWPLHRRNPRLAGREYPAIDAVPDRRAGSGLARDGRPEAAQGAFGSTKRQRPRIGQGRDRAAGVADLAAVRGSGGRGPRSTGPGCASIAEEQVVGDVGRRLGAAAGRSASRPARRADRPASAADRSRTAAGLMRSSCRCRGSTSASRGPRAEPSAEELQRVVAALLADPAERRLDPRRLLVAPARRAGWRRPARGVARTRRPPSPGRAGRQAPPPQPAPGSWASSAP